jgi:ATP-binding cassette subfamily C protein
MSASQLRPTAKRTALGDAFRVTWPAFGTAIIFSFFINLLLFVGPLYMLQIYDRVLTSRSETTLVGLTVLAALLIGVYASLEMLRSRVLVRAGVTFDQQVADRTFRSVHLNHLRNPNAGSGQCMRDLDTVREVMTGTGLIALCDAPWFPIFVFAAYVLHPWFGALALAASILTLALTLLNEFSTRKTLGFAAASSMQASQSLQSTLRNAEVMHAMGMARSFGNRWGRQHKEVIGFQALASDRAGSIIALTKFLRVFTQTAILGTGAYLAIHGEISPGAMIAASILIGRAMQPIEMAVANWKSLIAARAAFHRLRQLYDDTQSEVQRMSLPRPLGALALAGVIAAPPRLAKPGQPAPKPILHGVTFSVEPGESVAVIGPSAAGKSTLARVLTGVWPVLSGSVRLDGSDLSHWHPEELGPHLGYLPQDVELFGGTIAENIARQSVSNLSDLDEEAIMAAAQLAGCHELIQQLPQGYNTEIGDSGAILSGGQRQRVGLARALYGNPSLVILDEPNASLDSAGEAALLQAIQTLRAKKVTTIIITHKINILALVDKILILNGGSVQAFGPRDAVMAQLAGPRVVQSGTTGRSGNEHAALARG